MPYNPDRWLTSLVDTLEAVVRDGINTYMGVPDSTDIVEISMTHLGSERETSEDVNFGDLDKMLVLFNIDDIENQPLGFGRGVVDGDITEPTVSDPGTVLEYMGRMHQVNIDCGIVASDAAGGSSARLQGYEMLDWLFSPADRRESFRDVTNGIEIMSFTGGRFAKDTINDIRVFRVVGSELILRVYSRDTASDAVILADEITQEPSLIIGGQPIDDNE